MKHHEPAVDHTPRDCFGTDLTRIIAQRFADRFTRWEANYARYQRMRRRGTTR